MNRRGGWVAVCLALILPILWPLSGAEAGGRAQPGWSSLGPEGGGPSVITFDPSAPDTVYIGTLGGGIFRSLDGGATWESVRFGPSDDVTAIVLDPADPSTIFEAGSKGVFKTTDSGATWIAANDGLPITRHVADLAIDPSNPQVLYASSRRSAFKSEDGGESWQELSGLSGLNVARAEDLAVDPTNPQVVYLTVQFQCESCWAGGILKSTDGGTSWNALDSGLEGTADYHDLLIDPSAPDVLYVRDMQVSEGGGGVYTSTDAGDIWSFSSNGLPVDDGIPVRTLAIDPSQPSVLYAGVDGHSELYRTDDGAAAWSPISTGLDVDVVAPVAVDPSNSSVLLAGTSEPGVYRTETGGTSWTSSVSGLTNSVADDIAVAPSDPAVIYAWIEDRAQGDGVYRSTDGGGSWAWVSSGLPIPIFDVGSVAVDPADPQVAYASISSEGVYKTTDGGDSWAPASSGLADLYVGALVIDPSDPEVLYVADDRLYKSTNGGQSWTDASIGLGTFPHVSALIIDPSNPQTLYLSSQDSGGPSSDYTVYKTTDGALSWHLANTGMETASVDSLTVSPVGPGLLFAGTDSDGVYGSADGGATWHRRTSKLFGVVYRVASDPVLPSTAYAASRAHGVWRTDDGGLTWNPIKRGLTSRWINRLVLTPDGDKILAATRGGGVFWASL